MWWLAKGNEQLKCAVRRISSLIPCIVNCRFPFVTFKMFWCSATYFWQNHYFLPSYPFSYLKESIHSILGARCSYWHFPLLESRVDRYWPQLNVSISHCNLVFFPVSHLLLMHSYGILNWKLLSYLYKSDHDIGRYYEIIIVILTKCGWSFFFPQ